MNTPGPRAVHSKLEATAAEWIGRFDAGLNAAEMVEFERWQQENAAHREALARLDATWSALGRPRKIGAASMLADELAVLRRRRHQFRQVGAAALALCLAGAWAVWPALTPDETTAVVWTPERRTLPDGSIVEHQPGTELAIEFTDTVRRVTLKRGHAHFQVMRDMIRPFRVTAGNVDVRAVGTAFAMQLSGAAVEVLVTEGRVTVGPLRAEPGPADQNAALVAAGHRVTIDDSQSNTSEILAVTEAEIAERLSWRNPRVEFSGTPLAEVVALLNRHNEIRFVLADPSLGATALSGVFRLNDTEAFIRMLEKGFGVRHERRAQDVVLHRMP